MCIYIWHKFIWLVLPSYLVIKIAFHPEPIMNQSDVCTRCMITVTNQDKGIQCDVCDRWFHFDCVKMSQSEYKRHSSDDSLKWICNRVDCNNTGSTSISTSGVLEEILKKMDSLATKADIEPISKDIANLKDNFNSLSKAISDMEPRLNKVEREVKSLLDDAKVKSNNGSVDDIYSEIVDRTSRQSNAIIYGIPESKSQHASAKKSHDLELINTILHAAQSSPKSFTFFRIGKPSARSPRPIKLIFSCPNDAKEFFRHFHPDSLQDPNLAEVSVTRDRTVGERKFLENLRKTLDSRIKSGETDLTIKYINGTPQIVQKSKN